MIRARRRCGLLLSLLLPTCYAEFTTIRKPHEFIVAAIDAIHIVNEKFNRPSHVLHYR